MAARTSRPWKPIRIAKAHYRLFLAVAIGFGVGFLLPSDWRLTTRLLAGWNIGVALYLVQAFVTIVRFDLKRAQKRAANEDEGGALILALTIAAAIAALGAIVAQLGYAQATGVNEGIYFAHAAVTVLLSWTFIHIIFAFHYAHEYFGEGRDKTIGGLIFPGGAKPDYWDFVYFSFVVGTTFQVSDVEITSKHIRRTVMVHGIVSFFFSAAILALTVNIGSDLIKGGRKS